MLTAATLAVNVPLVWFAAMLTLPGTVTLALLLASATAAPLPGAGPDNVTVQLALPGAFTVPGVQLRLPGTTDTVRLTPVDWLCPFRSAVTVAVWLLPTVPLVTANAALLCPAATVTFAGTGSAALLLTSVTTTAPAAALLSVTVQLDGALLPRLDGEQDTEVSCAGALAVSVNVCVPPFKLAVSSAA